MTTKPKAKRFRIHRANKEASDADQAAVKAAAQAAAEAKATGTEDGFGDTAFPTTKPTASPQAETAAATSATAPRNNPDAERELEKIRAEGLTSRQLRMARRLALKHGMDPTSEFDAVRLLRAKGIDPFGRANMLELVVADKPDGAPGTGLQPAPTTAPAAPSLSEDRAREVREIQVDIARRRRRNLAALFARLAVFVFLPTFVAGYYFFVAATPMYATKSEFVIQQADNASSPMGGLFSGTGFATSQDSITVQSYLGSREAMQRLDQDIGFKAHFSQDNIDLLNRLEPDATNEDAYKVFKRNVKIGYDPTEGIIKMEVIAADPEVSTTFSRALIGYAEEQVDDLTQRLREDQMRGATESFEDAENKMVAAQSRVLELQEQLGVLDPKSETASIMSQISTFEGQLAEKQLRLSQLLDNAAPNQARVSGVEGDISRLQTLVAQLRGQLTEERSGETSLARINAQLSMAEVDLQTRTAMMQESLSSLEAARIEANRQVRYLSLGVNPVSPDEPTYPRSFENTLVAFFIFSGIYLMLSLTVAVLREQVSA